MYKNYSLVPLIVVTFFSIAFTAEDVHDHLLKAYRVSPAQEALFSRNGKMSTFWTEWDSVNKGGVVAMDFIDMIPSLNAWVDGVNAFKDSLDAQVRIRVAYGDAGLYLYGELIDDKWEDPAPGDYFSFFLDRISSQKIRDTTPDYYLGFPTVKTTFTFSSIRANASAGYGLGKLGHSFDIWRQADNLLKTDYCVADSISDEYAGWIYDADSTSARQRRIEWKIPWKWVGNNGGIGKLPGVGTMIAFTFRYRDVDSGIHTGLKELVWKERDPFSLCADLDSSHPYCDAWGDILISENTVGVKNNPVQSMDRIVLQGSNRLQFSAYHNGRLAPRIKTGTKSMLLYWSLEGRRVR